MSTTDTPANPPQAQRAPLWKRWPKLVATLVVLFLAIVGYLAYFYVGSRTVLQAALAQADEKDPGWRLPDLEANRLAVKDEENSGLVLIAAKPLLPPHWPIWSDKALPENKNRSDEELQALQKVIEEPDPPVQLSPGELQLLREELKRADPALKAARKIIDLRHGRYPFVYAPEYVSTAPPHTQDALLFAKLFACDALVHAQENDMDAALLSCRCILRVSDSIGDEPSMNSMLVRMAIRQLAIQQIQRVLAQGQPSEPALAALQLLLEGEENEPLLLIGLRGQRALTDEFIQRIENSDIKSAQVPSYVGGRQLTVTPLDNARMMLVPGFMNYQRAYLLGWHTIAVEWGKIQKLEGLRLAMDGHEAAAKGLPTFARLLHTEWSEPGKAWVRDQANMRCAITLLAMERYRRAKGVWPKVITDLVPEYLASIPKQFYDGAPLRVRSVRQGIVVETANNEYAGGMSDYVRPVGSRAARFQLKLWDADKRRQPPVTPAKPPSKATS